MKWIDAIERPSQLEAALSVTSRYLGLRSIDCKQVPNQERWTRLYLAFPLNAGLDPTWRPRRYKKQIASRVTKQLAPIRFVSSSSIELPEDSPLSFPTLRMGIQLSNKVADIEFFQFVRGDLSLFDVSFLSLLGLGRTGWCVSSEEQVDGVVARLPEFIAMAGEVVR